MKLYVKSKSKVEVNKKLANNEIVTGINHSIFGDGGEYALNKDLAEGTVIAIYDKYVGGNPYAKSWGTWKKGKVK